MIPPRQISLVCPVWNRAEFLVLALRSLNKYLDFGRIENFLLLDDLSTDGAGPYCHKWARSHPQARVVRESNPTLGTVWPLYRAFDLLGKPEWLGIWLSDWYMCQPLMPFLDQAMTDTRDADNIEIFCTETLNPVYGDKSVKWFNAEPRKNAVGDSLIGGFCLFRRSLLERSAPAARRYMRVTTTGISNTFNRHLRKECGIRFRTSRMKPPPPFLHLDYDLVGAGLSDEYYQTEGMDKKRLLGLVDAYWKKGWSRTRVAPNGRTVVQTGDVRKKDTKKRARQ